MIFFIYWSSVASLLIYNCHYYHISKPSWGRRITETTILTAAVNEKGSNLKYLIVHFYADLPTSSKAWRRSRSSPKFMSEASECGKPADNPYRYKRRTCTRNVCLPKHERWPKEIQSPGDIKTTMHWPCLVPVSPPKPLLRFRFVSPVTATL